MLKHKIKINILINDIITYKYKKINIKPKKIHENQRFIYVQFFTFIVQLKYMKIHGRKVKNYEKENKENAR